MPTASFGSQSNEYLTFAQVAAQLFVSEMTVSRLFRHTEGVLNLGTPETLHKRKRSLLRIPPWAVEKFIAEKANAPKRKA